MKRDDAWAPYEPSAKDPWDLRKVDSSLPYADFDFCIPVCSSGLRCSQPAGVNGHSDERQKDHVRSFGHDLLSRRP